MIWIATATMLAVFEMLTGTFYLLVLALGAAAGAAVAGMGASITVQLGAAAVITALGWGALYKFGPRFTRREASGNPDVNPDIGAIVRITEVSDTGTHKVTYRGTTWTARVEHTSAELNRDYIIARVEGATLILHAKH
jgi:membrane protein implicated in regulation of membrane protease activity